jgi:hypothetical protein
MQNAHIYLHSVVDTYLTFIVEIISSDVSMDAVHTTCTNEEQHAVI